MQTKGRYLYAGVYGTKDGEIVLPTMSANLGQIYQGTEPGESAQPPTPSVYEQLLADIGNLDELDTQTKASLVAAINEVYATGGGGGGGAGNVSSPEISTIRVMDQADYADLDNPDENTLYLLRG